MEIDSTCCIISSVQNNYTRRWSCHRPSTYTCTSPLQHVSSTTESGGSNLPAVSVPYSSAQEQTITVSSF